MHATPCAGAELVFYSCSHTVQNEYITRLCKDVEERQLTNDDGSVLQVNAMNFFKSHSPEACVLDVLLAVGMKDG
eukprot:SAG11_NODE_1623_length_4559_cov_2.141480_8_plen_75_part_00